MKARTLLALSLFFILATGPGRSADPPSDVTNARRVLDGLKSAGAADDAPKELAVVATEDFELTGDGGA